jgi:hypothetical protein
MINLKYIFATIAISLFLTSCTTDSVSGYSETIHANGDQADDPIEPDEEALHTGDLVSSTGDQADDPIEPDDED